MAVGAGPVPAAAIEAAGSRDPYAGDIYAEPQFYTLYANDTRQAINVPGTDVCIDGNQLRSKEQFTIAETKTNFDKCWIRDLGGDKEKLICPREAETQVVHFNHYLVSPLVYTVRTCLLYDKANCYMRYADDSPEREMCRIDFQYEGIWADDTMFHYKCARSQPNTYRHSLQYTVRWFMEILQRGEPERLRKREVYRETRSVPRCS
jgi:hypothetical protein